MRRLVLNNLLTCELDDDEEKNLMTAMGELYLEDALTVYVIRKGVRFYVGDAKKFVGDRDKPELDAELNETIDRRLNEDREFELSERSFLNSSGDMS